MNNKELSRQFDTQPETKGCRGCWFFETDHLETCIQIVPLCRGLIYVPKQVTKKQFAGADL
ncbi:hypothetical protein [Mangrovibacterium sp.]|uniref:hypothetical protein n=1 Tax=Mangrovibacterium sp. TaxID=1961364 RepID=UPI00356A565D